ncbi:MAG: ribonuclease III [Gammaproteobacteria bacterium]
MAPEDTLPAIASRIGHRFARPGLLQLALTHPSFGSEHNERLEFLGDALLNLGIAIELYQRHPGLREGQLSRLRAQMVRAETLAGLARELGLGAALRLGTGEAAAGGRDKESILADALEAVIAAVQLDAGTDAALACISRCFEGRLGDLDPEVSHKDAKTELQELLQARRRPLPRYEVIELAPASGSGNCRVLCHVPGLADPVEGSGRNRRLAEQQAARRALDSLQFEGGRA